MDRDSISSIQTPEGRYEKNFLSVDEESQQIGNGLRREGEGPSLSSANDVYDEYTFIPLGDDTFQVFKTSELPLHHPALAHSPSGASGINGSYETVASSSPINDDGGAHTVDNSSFSEDEPMVKSRKLSSLNPLGHSLADEKKKPTRRKKAKEPPPVTQYECNFCDAVFHNEFTLIAHRTHHTVWKEGAEEAEW